MRITFPEGTDAEATAVNALAGLIVRVTYRDYSEQSNGLYRDYPEYIPPFDAEVVSLDLEAYRLRLWHVDADGTRIPDEDTGTTFDIDANHIEELGVY